MQTTVKLPPPQKDLDFPLMKALEARRSKRKWKSNPLSEQQLSNLLWAACGITLPATPRSKSRRTAPSATNSQEIKVYLALEHGLYLYDETRHKLLQIHNRDIRTSIGTQKMMHSAPVGRGKSEQSDSIAFNRSILYRLGGSPVFLLNPSSFIHGEEGLNLSGLAVAMTFVVPRPSEIQPGLNSVFLVRYLLEHFTTVPEALQSLHRLPMPTVT